MTTYKLEFLPSASKEWKKLGSATREQFTRKLRERLEQPRIPSAKLRNLPDCYKIKLRAAGYRLIYRVDDGRIIVVVIEVGRRDRDDAYSLAEGRVKSS